jgi:molecular chaperone GrpE
MMKVGDVDTMAENQKQTEQQRIDEQNETTESMNQQHAEQNGFETTERQEGEAAPDASQVTEGEVISSEEAAPSGEQQQIAELEAQLAEYKDQWMRAVADFKNYKRRAETERAELLRTAGVGVAQKILPIIDDFERAVDNVPPEIESHSWWEGTKLILHKLHALLESENITPIDALGEDFDPNLHDAVLYEEAEGQDGKVVAELQKGYRVGERVLRPTMVKVGKG